MLRRRGSAGLLLLVALTTASVAACRTKTGDATDGASDAASDAAGGDGSTAAAAATSSALEAGGAIPTDPAATAPPTEPSLPRPTPFSGSFRCLKSGMQLEQSGNIVMSTIHKDATTDTILACTVIGDSCTGTVRDIHLAKTKSRKVTNVRPVTVVRTGTGDMMIKMGQEQKTDATSKPSSSRTTSSSKAAAGDQTFCQRR
jgi:hypothetical protein